ncbi:tetratricopeptide repeat protein [Mesorhizobium huakuii]|uniref:Tetratricopeptide repeat protein n=1 Tax=Mesorhizobium huakuii TaxID=28104 RepID=A0A7G6T559_9HYPH|nr:tetratricopeptide repeat protein [Mesorhizobium huakuii]QND61891.1 tetratricopeptide repeat protein [Mesorhizobium huakuii]QND69105.1 tetratricopeptide repeat protein [Mesorhizobium loti]
MSVEIAAQKPDARAVAAASVGILRAGQTGNIEEAIHLALAHISYAADFPRLAQVSLQAFLKGSRNDAATRLVDNVVAKGKASPEVAVLAIRHLLGSDRAGDAYAFARTLLEGNGKVEPRLAEAAARAALASDKPVSEALEILEKAKSSAGNDGIFLRAYGELLLSAGRYAEAVDVLAPIVSLRPNTTNTRLLLARALKHAHRLEEACTEMLTAVKLDPSVTNRSSAVALLLQVGREAEAKQLYGDMVSERKNKLTRTFSAGLAALDARLDEVKLPQRRLDWAWEIVSQKLGYPPSPNREDWDRRAKWGHLLDKLIQDWLECSIDQAGEIASFFNVSDANRNTVIEARDEGKGVLLVSAHIGPMFAGPVAIHSFGTPYRWLSSTPRILTTGFANTLISTADLNEVQVARCVIDSLRAGCLVTLAADGAMSPNAPRITWEGKSITYSPFCAMLSYKTKVPTIFTSPLWAENQFRFVVKRLPTAEAGEGLRQFSSRWQQAFFEEVTNVLVTGPENLRLNGGLWRNI